VEWRIGFVLMDRSCPDWEEMMQPYPPKVPRLVVAGLSGDSGKTLVSLALLFLARRLGVSTRAFKKGPDYIDAAWLSWASGGPARNLDTYLTGREKAATIFLANSVPDGLNLIEGNRGLFDGLDARGTHSTAELAKLLKAPVLLVVNAAKVTHTVAALVLGCVKLDPQVRIEGVILNHVSGSRHESVARRSVELECGVPVLGVLPNVEAGNLLPNRHLGLVTPQEHGNSDLLRETLLAAVQGRFDTARILKLAESVPALPGCPKDTSESENGRGLRIVYLKDSAFTFYYPENLEALESSGAELLPISALAAATLPEDLDALYIGGGFPETHSSALSQNSSLLASIHEHALKGLPVYAECGGLMLLAQAIRWKGNRFPMAGVLPFEVEVCARPQGHGYAELLVDSSNPYYPVGTRIRAHEFHYSKIIPAGALPPTACAVQRGTGCFDERDGILMENVWASYAHVHAAGTPEWNQGFLAQAQKFRRRRIDQDGFKHPLHAKPDTVSSVY
jgi:cobyrinic acid a,c-diamide synthase